MTTGGVPLELVRPEEKVATRAVASHPHVIPRNSIVLRFERETATSIVAQATLVGFDTEQRSRFSPCGMKSTHRWCQKLSAADSKARVMRIRCVLYVSIVRICNAMSIQIIGAGPQKLVIGIALLC